MTPFHQAARDYLELGFHPIPCGPRSKRPLVEWRQWQTQTPPAELVDRWWAETPDANVALVLGRGTFAVDLDGGAAEERLLKHRGILLPREAPRSRTGHGSHVFFRADRAIPDKVALLSANGQKPQVDIRGVGIVVVPPSIHPDGPTYQWEVPLCPPLPDAPSLLLDLILGPTVAAPTAGPAGTQTWVGEALRGVGEGQRDMTCTKLAGLLLGKGVDAETTIGLLAHWAAACTPPFPLADVRKVVRSIAMRESLATEPDQAVTAVSLGAALDEWLTRTEPQPVATPFAPLTKYLGGGWSPGDLNYLGARPGVGKTAFALECARSVAQTGRGALVISREMARTALARRMLSQASRVPAAALRAGRLDLMQQDRMDATIRQLRGLPVWLCDAAVSLREITSLVAQWGETPLGFVVVDYLQLVRGPADIRERRLSVEAVSQGLKTLALQTRIPVLCLSSLSRQPGEKGAEEARPTLDRLRESGELEHDADVVLFLHRKFGVTETECIVAKNRDGRTGVAKLQFLPEFVAFEAVGDDA